MEDTAISFLVLGTFKTAPRHKPCLIAIPFVTAGTALAVGLQGFCNRTQEWTCLNACWLPTLHIELTP